VSIEREKKRYIHSAKDVPLQSREQQERQPGDRRNNDDPANQELERGSRQPGSEKKLKQRPAEGEGKILRLIEKIALVVHKIFDCDHCNFARALDPRQPTLVPSSQELTEKTEFSLKPPLLPQLPPVQAHSLERKHSLPVLLHICHRPVTGSRFIERFV
jgi:hypothetical protein